MKQGPTSVERLIQGILPENPVYRQLLGLCPSLAVIGSMKAAMTMAGEVGPAAFLDVRSIGGLNQSVNRNLTKQVCALLEEKLGIPGDRVYVSFASSAAVDWGWNSSTFG